MTRPDLPMTQPQNLTPLPELPQIQPKRSADAARTNNIIATLALIAAVIAIALSIIGIFLKGNDP